MTLGREELARPGGVGKTRHREIVHRLRERATAARSEGTATALGDAIHFEEAATEIEALRKQVAEKNEALWRPIKTAPKDGTRFWGNVGDDAIAMLWHGGFGEFVSGWWRMTMAPGYEINGRDFEDHSPTSHKPTHWMPLPEPPARAARGKE